MPTNLVVGLTGGIASGKSVVASSFERLGVDVIDADQIAREIVEPGQPALEEIRRRFGSEAIDGEGRLRRRHMRELIFDDEQARRDLEAIMHPRIREALAEKSRAAQSEYCILVVPLLIKSGMSDLVDRILVVDAPESVQVERLTSRDNIDETLARKMIAAQDTRSLRLEAADDVLVNTGPYKDIADLAAALHSGYSRLARGEVDELPPMHLPG